MQIPERLAKVIVYGAAMAQNNARCAREIQTLRAKYKDIIAPEDLNKMMDIVEDLTASAEDFLDHAESLPDDR